MNKYYEIEKYSILFDVSKISSKVYTNHNLTDIQYKSLSKKNIEVEKVDLNKAKKKYTKGEKTKLLLLERDGNKCFYSNEIMTLETATIEHLIAKSIKGCNSHHNLVLCLQKHNSKVGNLPLIEKIKYREQLRKEVRVGE